jgi:hypothetical protein
MHIRLAQVQTRAKYRLDPDRWGGWAKDFGHFLGI